MSTAAIAAIVAIVVLSLCLLALLIGRTIDRAEADDALRNAVALVVELIDDPDIPANLNV